MKTKPRKPEPLAFPIFESMAHFAGMLEISLDVVKQAKKLGCKCFISGGRIDSLALMRFLLKERTAANKLPEGFASWKEFGDMQRALCQEIELKERRHELMEIAEAKRQVAIACQHFDAELTRAEIELPPALAGTTSGDAFKVLHRFCQNLRQATRDKFNGLTI